MAVRPFDPVQEAPIIVAILIPVLILLAFGGFAFFGALMSPAALSSPATIQNIFTPTLLVGFGLAALVGLVLSLLSTGAVYGASADALAGRTVDFASLMTSGPKHAGSIFVFYVIICGVGLVAELVVALLAMISHGILGVFGFIALFGAAIYAAFLLMYGLPAIVVGGKNPGNAMLDSADLARANVGPTLILILAGIVLAIGVGVVNLAAFIALFSVHFYHAAFGRTR
ncbi:MAG TPA: hypothetical protein VII69_01960 [Candidatus Eremiobacteraceae bacterium]